MLLGRDGSGAEMKGAGSVPTGPMGWEGAAICLQVFLKETTVQLQGNSQVTSCER